jgi:hypothetical protein
LGNSIDAKAMQELAMAATNDQRLLGISRRSMVNATTPVSGRAMAAEESA